MAVHIERRALSFTPDQIFDLVVDVERYPDFLPLWHAAVVIRSGEDSHFYTTRQTLQLGPVRKTFHTENRMQRPGLVRVTSDDPLFDEFLIQWQLGPGAGRSCLVDFSLRCEAASLLLRPVFEVVLVEAAQMIVSAFERRAHSLYSG